jgi:hypothetical protein
MEMVLKLMVRQQALLEFFVNAILRELIKAFILFQL